jgi:hypothetical protein
MIDAVFSAWAKAGSISDQLFLALREVCSCLVIGRWKPSLVTAWR